jgi:ferric-dicitrate binding protein FerR (iron transport regulator)
MTVSNVNTIKFTSWKEGIINIYDQSLEQVVKRLESRYNQKFRFGDDIKDYRYTFTIKNEPLDEIINLMEKITPVKTIQKDEVIVFQMDVDKMRKSMDKH